MITATSPAKPNLHYNVDDTTRTVLTGIFKRIGARLPATNTHSDEPLSARYIPGIDMLECLHDLKSLIDRSDRPQSILCLLMEWRVVEEHLAPLLMALRWERQPEACLVCCRLINYFINPTETVGEEEGLAVERLYHQRLLKRHLGSNLFISHILTILVSFFRLETLQVEQEEAVKSAMFMLKAIVMIPDPEPSSKRLGLYGRSEQVFEVIYETRMYEFLLCLVGQLDKCGFLFKSLLEIFGTIFGGAKNYSFLFSDAQEPAITDPSDDAQVKRPVRHGRFAGSVVVQLSTGRELVLKSSSQFTTGVDYDVGKRQSFRRKQVDYHQHTTSSRTLPEHLMDIYRQAADDFLNSAFNTVITMATEYLLKHMSDRDAPDVVHHVAELSIFFLRFVDHHGHDCGLVAAVTERLGFLLQRHYTDCLLDKKWSEVVQGVLFWRHFVEHCSQSDTRFDQMARQVFYDYDLLRHLAVVMTQIKRASLGTATVLLEAAHVWLKAVERHCNTRAVMLVGKRKRVQKSYVFDSDSDGVDKERVEREFRFTQLLSVLRLILTTNRSLQMKRWSIYACLY